MATAADDIVLVSYYDDSPEHMEWVLGNLTDEQTESIEEFLEERHGPGGRVQVGPVRTESFNEFTESFGGK